MSGDSTAPGKVNNEFFKEHDNTFIVYHAYTRAANRVPLLNIKLMYMDEEDWLTPDKTGKLFARKEMNSSSFEKRIINYCLPFIK